MNYNEYFVLNIFWSTWNADVIAQSPDHKKKNKWRSVCLVADAKKRSVFHGDQIDYN